MAATAGVRAGSEERCREGVTRLESLIEATLEEAGRRGWRRVGDLSLGEPVVDTEPLGRLGIECAVLDQDSRDALDKANFRVMEGRIGAEYRRGWGRAATAQGEGEPPRKDIRHLLASPRCINSSMPAGRAMKGCPAGRGMASVITRRGESAMKSMPRRTFLGATAGALAASPLMAARARGPNETLGVGLIGVGNRGSVLLKNLLQIPGVEVRAICDIDPGRLETAAKVVEEAGRRRPKLTTDGSWKEILAADGLDAIVSAIPCDLHAGCYLDAIAAGKDLYGEKPMCLSRADLDAVVKAARESKQIVQIGHQRRADPHFIEPIAAVHRGEIGDLVEGRILWSNSWGPLYGWFGQRKRSGDWIVEQAVHNWDVINWAVDAAPVRAAAMGRNDLFRDRQPDRDVHDYYSGVVEYPGNVFVNIIHSWVAPGKFNEEYTRLDRVQGRRRLQLGDVLLPSRVEETRPAAGRTRDEQYAAVAPGLRQFGTDPQRARLHRRTRPRRGPRLPPGPSLGRRQGRDRDGPGLIACPSAASRNALRRRVRRFPRPPDRHDPEPDMVGSTPDGEPGGARWLTPITCAASARATLGLAMLVPRKS